MERKREAKLYNTETLPNNKNYAFRNYNPCLLFSTKNLQLAHINVRTVQCTVPHNHEIWVISVGFSFRTRKKGTN